jgi:hypothetical protein
VSNVTNQGPCDGGSGRVYRPDVQSDLVYTGLLVVYQMLVRLLVLPPEQQTVAYEPLRSGRAAGW